MLSAPIRFALEAGVLIAVALALVAADMGLLPFVLFMATAWILVAAAERFATRPGTARSSFPEPLPVHQEREPAHAEPVAGGEPQPDTFEPLAPPETEPARPEPEPVAEVEPDEAETVEPEPEPPKLEAVPTPEPELPVELEENGRPEPVVELPQIVHRSSDGWNLWDLEQRAKERAGDDPYRDEEWTALMLSLRDFASPDGTLPPEFDELVHESFGELVSSRRR